MVGWDQLGVVGTIYEEEDQEEEEEEEESTNKSFSLALSLTTSPVSPYDSSSSILSAPSLHSVVEEWSMARGCKPDVVIRLHDQRLDLHKEPLASRSRYLRRRLRESTDITVIPPSNITAETFAEIFLFCYDSAINLTPSNLAAVRSAAEWLEMEVDGEVDGSLIWRTEMYFRQEIAGVKKNAKHVLSTCTGLLPDVTAAVIAVRCVDVVEREGGDGEWMEELTALGLPEFRAIAEAMRTWFAHDHDLLYQVVDHYLQKHTEKLSEDDKVRICSTISSIHLSHHHLLHLVQNPFLPLRFVVQSILLHHLHHSRDSYLPLQPPSQPTATTLGSILHRDATLRQSSHIRASMRATAFRIDSLEHDLEGLRRKLRWSEEKTAEMEAVRASSFRMIRQNEVEVEEVGSSGRSCKSGKGIGRKLVDGLKSVFGTSPTTTTKMNKVRDERKITGHRRNNSFA